MKVRRPFPRVRTRIRIRIHSHPKPQICPCASQVTDILLQLRGVITSLAWEDRRRAMEGQAKLTLLLSSLEECIDRPLPKVRAALGRMAEETRRGRLGFALLHTGDFLETLLPELCR